VTIDSLKSKKQYFEIIIRNMTGSQHSTGVVWLYRGTLDLSRTAALSATVDCNATFKNKQTNEQLTDQGYCFVCRGKSG